MQAKAKGQRKYLMVSDVLARLSEFKDEYGDLPIRVQLAGMNSKPVISGVRYSAPKDGANGCISIVPKYDVRGIVNEMSGANSLVKQIADVQLLFVQYAQMMMQAKATLEEIQKRGGNISPVRKPFVKLYEIAKDIRDGIKSIQGLDKRLVDVAKETIRDSDYAVTFAHHIDEDMTDAGFAALVTDGIGEKTSVQRLAVYVEIIRKINAEIANRKRRIAALEKRIKADSGQESMNAKILISKSEGIVATLQKRRDYVSERFTALWKSVSATMTQFGEEINKLYDEQPDIHIQKGRNR